MKKIVYTTFVLFGMAVVFSTSCVKEYNCECTDTQISNDSVVDENTHVIEAKKYEEAENICNDKDDVYPQYKRECSLTSF